MIVSKFDSEPERSILIAMIVHTGVLSQIAGVWDGRLFAGKPSNLIANWCVEHYREYGKAPKRIIETIYAGWQEVSPDKDSDNFIGELLSGLSGQYSRMQKQINSKYILDAAQKHFDKIAVDKLNSTCGSYNALGKTDKALDAINNFRRVQLGAGTAFKVFTDEERLKACFSVENQDPIFEMPGALGRFFGRSLCRGVFMSFLGPDKSGKSYWLQELAYQAALNHKKVAVLECGDMSEAQWTVRLASRIAKHPCYGDVWPLTVKYPTALAVRRVDREGPHGRTVKRDEGFVTAHKEMIFDHRLQASEAVEACREELVRKFRTRESPIWFSAAPADSFSVSDMRSQLRSWARDGFFPDLVIVDYADILAHMPGVARLDERDRINKDWKQLRGLAQEMNCLVFTATQGNADSYDRWLLSKKNYSEDKRKNAHTAAIISINMSTDEQARGVARLGWMFRRQGYSSWKKLLHVAHCFALNNPCVLSEYREEIDED